VFGRTFLFDLVPKVSVLRGVTAIRVPEWYDPVGPLGALVLAFSVLILGVALVRAAVVSMTIQHP